MYNAYVTRIKNVRKHPNADKLLLGECFGNTVCVDLSFKEGELGVYFPTDGQLSKEFAEANNLLRKKDENGNSIGGYMDPDKRNVCAIRLRGEKSDGLFLSLSCLSSFGDISSLKEGDVVSTFNGKTIAEKYIPKRKVSQEYIKDTKRNRKIKMDIAPLFKEHVDTEQLAYNLGVFKPQDEVEITLKMHGTSQRTGFLPVLSGYKRRNLWEFLAKKEKTPIFKYSYISGTRRTILENFEGGFYGDNHFRQQHHDKFIGKLNKGETVYYEVVGFTDFGTPIMGKGNNKKLGKDFCKKYGDETTFNYGCKEKESECYVYRMTLTNEDGFTVEYTPEFMRYRCEQMGVKTVPVFWHGQIPKTEKMPGEWIKRKAEEYYDGTDPVGKTHIREGVVIRLVDKPTFTAYKHKNFSFKVLEGLIKDAETAPDMEEAQELI